jgi:hypothetical protein
MAKKDITRSKLSLWHNPCETRKYAVPNQMERISHIRKFMASRERINKCQGTLRPVQAMRKTYNKTKTKHSSIAGATGT